MERKIKILIADHSQVFREGLKTIFHRHHSIEIVGEASTGAMVVEMVKRAQPDIVLVDVVLPELNGIDTAKIIHTQYPLTTIVAVSETIDKKQVMSMIHAGALGYLAKSSSKKEFLNAVESVSQNIPYYSPEVADMIKMMTGHRPFKPNPDSDTNFFTQTEFDIIELICQQKSTKEIADTLCLSVRTIEGYRKKIEEKMDVKNTAGIVIYAIRKKLFRISFE